MKILVIGCHPDDEVLGCGGTILKHVEKGHNVYICIVTEAVKSLGFSKEEGEKRRREALEASRMLGVSKNFFLDMPAAHLDTVPLFELINNLTKVIKEVQPDIIYTHYNKDLNQDHRKVSYATLIASRPPAATVKKLYFYESISSTTYNMLIDEQFSPNTLVNISKYIEKKKEILGVYQSEMRGYPHARSQEGIDIYAKFRGLMCGCNAAEAFILYREVI